MKRGIHPDYHPVVFRDSSTGEAFLSYSTATSTRTIVWRDGNIYPVIDLDVTSSSHPLWTGKTRVFDTEGRVQAFQRRYGGTR